ncbi:MULTISPECIES: hypothetical protein [unclassified Streptomyces]|uniref:hypothetical protein n=1 Tax=unclassified Streptomyces TaxID=2593676 RepID=UPI0024415B8B|nr:hypothetical protein [Streptomyces sp. DH41]MDG9728679.1 hypothetical protein [Streptomyces sp. DH41]
MPLTPCHPDTDEEDGHAQDLETEVLAQHDRAEEDEVDGLLTQTAERERQGVPEEGRDDDVAPSATTPRQALAGRLADAGENDRAECTTGKRDLE